VTHTPTDLVDHTIGPYHLERLLGQGGFAWVFVGRELDGTPVAVKILKPRYGGDPQFEIRFRNEAETAAKLDHPNIIRIRFVARSREGPLPESDILVIAADVARGLDFAHRQGVVHRDLKPDNILMHSDGSAVISDFGIARAVSGYVASTGVNMTIGTPHYISPEQAQGRPVDQRADFYALGVTLYKAATGEVPFTSTDWFELARMHVEKPPPSLRKKRPELTKRFERVVMKCLAKHPDDRYADAAALLADLTDFDTRQRATADVGRAPVKEPHVSWRLVAAIVVGAALLVLLVIRLMR